MLSEQKYPQASTHEKEIASELLKAIREFAIELQIPQSRLQNLNLDTSFDHDLGLDSLSRVEFISRIETRFGLRLSETALVNVDSPRKLIEEILMSGGNLATAKKLDVSLVERAETQQQPVEAETLVDVLRWHTQIHPDRPHIKLYDDDNEQEQIITYGELWEGAEKIAVGLQHNGLTVRQAVSIMLPTGKDYLFSFFGILMAGGIPAPVYPPARISQLEDHLVRHQGILANCQAPIMITMPEAKQVARLLKTQVRTLQTVITAPELSSTGASLLPPKLNTDDIAFLQYTSGSTGTPKGVVLSHANLLANIRIMGERVKIGASDTFVSWLPLYHDMGLIGAVLGSQYFSALLVLMSPLAFLSKPARWLWAIHRNRGTMTAAPNFAYELCSKRVTDDEIAGIDLSSLRSMFNGAEPVKPTTLQQFNERYQPYGLSPTVIKPVYGLAECSLGLAFPACDREAIIDSVDRDVFSRTAQAVPATEGKDDLKFVNCGQPLPQHEIRIVDGAGRELPERRQGRLQFKGPSISSGYYRNPEQTQKLFDGDWIDSGDLAYVAEGEVYLTGRVKDLIIHGGRNIYPHELEDAVSEIPGIRKGCVAAFASSSEKSVTERLIVLAETREKDPAALESLRSNVLSVTVNLIGSAPEEVVLAPPYTVLKTSSGKIRRSACREIYEKGQIGKGPKAVWKQVISLITASIVPQVKEAKSLISDALFAAYAWAVLVPIASVTWLWVYLDPRESRRWKFVHLAARLVTSALRIPVVVQGKQNFLPTNQPCIYVCNHASYIDGVTLMVALPNELKFVAKSELKGQFVAGNFLRRIGSHFVERFDTQKSIEDARRVAEKSTAGQSLLFFPEGTLTRMPGLLPFHMGAFVTAAESNLPILPISIRGTRSILRADTLFPRHHAPVLVTIGKPIYPKMQKEAGDKTFDVALKLRKLAREALLSSVGEPDLGSEKSPI